MTTVRAGLLGLTLLLWAPPAWATTTTPSVLPSQPGKDSPAPRRGAEGQRQRLPNPAAPAGPSADEQAARRLLTRAQQVAGLPAQLSLYHEQTRIREGEDVYSSDLWVDLAGQRTQLTETTAGTLDAVHLLTLQRDLLYTPQGGTVPVPRRAAQVLRSQLRSSALGLGAAAQPGVQVRALGPQTWLDTKALRLEGTALEACWPGGAVWTYLLDPQTGRLLADRSGPPPAKKGGEGETDPPAALPAGDLAGDLGGLITYQGDLAAAAPATAQKPQGQVNQVRTLLLPSGEVLLREEVLVQQFNPAAPDGTFTLPQAAQAGGTP